MISSSDSCRQLVAGNYDVILDDDEVASFKSVLNTFLARFEHHENELLICHQQQQQQLQLQQQQQQQLQLQLTQNAAPPPPSLMVGSYVNEFKMLKELSRTLKENTANYIDGLECFNQAKNRYKDIIPFNHSRVVLNQIPHLEPGSDYINANYVQGPSGSQRSYIACQGPLPHTLSDFWRMIWECRVSVIVMACNEQEMGRAKCEQYWPDQVDMSLIYGNIKVTLLRERQINSDFLIRKFSVQLLEPELKTSSPESAQTTQTTPTSANSPQPPLPPPPPAPPQAACDKQSELVQHIRDQLANGQCNDDDNNNKQINVGTQSGPQFAHLAQEHQHSCGFSNSGTSSTSNESINTSDYSSGANLSSSQSHDKHHSHTLKNHLEPNLNQMNQPQNHFHNQQHVKTDQGDNNEQIRTQSNRQSNRAVLMERTVCQFHFQGWQDHGVPDSVQSILELIRLIREVQPGYSSSIVVHCSAGCGRTGTICCIDYVYGLIRMGKLMPDFDLFTIICNMRQQRMAMVQTIEQYILCHRAVAALFVQQLQMLQFGASQNSQFLTSTASGQATTVGYDELTKRDGIEPEETKEVDESNHYDTSTSTVATDELSTSSKLAIVQNGHHEADQNDGGYENENDDDDEDIGPVFI